MGEELARAGTHGPGFAVHNDINGGYLNRLATPPTGPLWIRAPGGPTKGTSSMPSPLQVLARLTAAGVTGGLLTTGLTALPATADDRPLPAGRVAGSRTPSSPATPRPAWPSASTPGPPS